MFRDVSEIQDAPCITIIDDKTIQTLNTGITTNYKLISNKYYKTTEQTTSSAIPGTATTCYTLEEIQSLPSPYDFITPIYHSVAIASAMLLFYFAYRLILYPFFRTKL